MMHNVPSEVSLLCPQERCTRDPRFAELPEICHPTGDQRSEPTRFKVEGANAEFRLVGTKVPFCGWGRGFVWKNHSNLQITRGLITSPLVHELLQDVSLAPKSHRDCTLIAANQSADSWN
jgi:hypothetical protein